MIKRFFLDGIDAKTAGSTIGSQDDFVIPTGSDETEPVLAFSEPAEARAEVTLQATIIELMPVPSGNRANVRFFSNLCLPRSHQRDIGVKRPGRNGPRTVFLRM